MKRSGTNTLRVNGFQRIKMTKDGLPEALEKATVMVQNDEPAPLSYESLQATVSNSLYTGLARDLCERLAMQIDAHTRSILDQFKRNDLECLDCPSLRSSIQRNGIGSLYLFVSSCYI